MSPSLRNMTFEFMKENGFKNYQMLNKFLRKY